MTGPPPALISGQASQYASKSGGRRWGEVLDCLPLVVHFDPCSLSLVLITISCSLTSTLGIYCPSSVSESGRLSQHTTCTFAAMSRSMMRHWWIDIPDVFGGEEAVRRWIICGGVNNKLALFVTGAVKPKEFLLEHGRPWWDKGDPAAMKWGTIIFPGFSKRGRLVIYNTSHA